MAIKHQYGNKRYFGTLSEGGTLRLYDARTDEVVFICIASSVRTRRELMQFVEEFPYFLEMLKEGDDSGI